MASHFPLQYSGHRTNLYQFTYKVQGMINLIGTVFIVGARLRTESLKSFSILKSIRLMAAYIQRLHLVNNTSFQTSYWPHAGIKK